MEGCVVVWRKRWEAGGSDSGAVSEAGGEACGDGFLKEGISES